MNISVYFNRLRNWYLINSVDKKIRKQYEQNKKNNFFEPKKVTYIFEVKEPSKYDDRGEVTCPVCGMIWRSIIIRTSAGWYYDPVYCKGPAAERLHHEVWRLADRYRYNTTGEVNPVMKKIQDLSIELWKTIPDHAEIIPPMPVMKAIEERDDISNAERSGIVQS